MDRYIQQAFISHTCVYINVQAHVKTEGCMLEYLMIMRDGEETEGSYVDKDGDHEGARGRK